MSGPDAIDEAVREDDVRELVRSIRTDREAAKEKERREGWTKYVSLMVVVLAVATGVGALKGAGFSSRVMLKQAQASDTWAFYQAKSIKQRIAEMETRGATGPEAARAEADVVRYRADEKDLQTKAERLEAERDDAAKHGPPLGFSITCLQIAIALASVCLITKRRLLWGASALLGAIGVFYLFYGLYFV
jgi:hypothetical protein